MLVYRIRVGAGGHERGDHLNVASQGGIVQRGRPVLLPHGIGVGASREVQILAALDRDSYDI